MSTPEDRNTGGDRCARDARARAAQVATLPVMMPVQPTDLSMSQCRALAHIPSIRVRIDMEATADGPLWKRAGGWLLVLTRDALAGLEHLLGSLPWLVFRIGEDRETGLAYFAIGADKMTVMG